MKTLRNFLVANLCAVLPLLWISFGWMPEPVMVELRGNGETPVAVGAKNVVLQGLEYGHWQEGVVWKVYLRKGMEWRDLTFRLPDGMDENCVGRVWMEKWKVLSLGKSGAGLRKKEGPGNVYVFLNPRFEWVGVLQGKMPRCVAVLEIFLLGLSWWCSRRHREEPWKTLLPSVLGIAFALSLLMQVTLPVQSYVSNQSSFPFTPGELCGYITLRFVVSLVACVACLGVLSRLFGRWVLSGVLAFAICAYLESGILAEGLPSLNGDWGFFADRDRGIKNFAVWGGVFFVVLGVHRWMKPWLGVAGLCWTGMFCAAMLDAKPEEKADMSNLLVNDFSSIGSVLESVTYSTNRNVMVFIIDSLERHQAHAIMEDPEVGAELRKKFLGFTEYTNNIGACEFSLPAVANLMTGNYPTFTMDPDFYASVYSPKSVIKDYLQAGYAVYTGTSALGYGYTNRKQEHDSATGKSKWKSPVRGSSEWGLTPFCRFRWIPFLAKAQYAFLIEMGKAICDDAHDISKEKTVCEMLAQAPVSPEETGSFLLVHTDGVHVPVIINRYGDQLPKENNTDEGCVENGIYIFSQLGNLLDIYRKQEIYDRALIIVLADHGHHGGDWAAWRGEEAEFPGNGCPFLWIKPPFSTHPFTSSSVPTTHSKLFCVLREALARDLNDRDIERILAQETRLYRRGADPNWHDYHVMGDHTWYEEFVPQGASDISKMRPLPLGKMHSLKFTGLEMRERGNIFFNGFLPQREGALAGWMPIWAPPQQQISLAFKVASASHGYHVQLIGHVREQPETEGPLAYGCVHFFARGEKEQQVSVCDEGVLEVVLESVIPDENGIIEIVGERDDGCALEPVFTQLRVTRHAL